MLIAVVAPPRPTQLCRPEVRSLSFLIAVYTHVRHAFFADRG